MSTEQTFTLGATLLFACAAWLTSAQAQTSTNVGTAGDPLVAGVVLSSSPGDYDVVAGGSDIWGTADHFHFFYEQRTGDFDVRVRVEYLEPTSRYSKASLMARESLTAGSRHRMAAVNPVGTTHDAPRSGGIGENAYDFVMRTVTDGASAGWLLPSADATNPAYPNAWIRLRRQGDVFQGYRSSDGVNWTLIGESTQALPPTLYVGMATTSRNNNAGYTARASYRSYGNFIMPLPQITSQPQSREVRVGETAIFWVSAAGALPLSFQWRKGGEPLPEATSSSLSLINAQPSDAGNFDVVVSGPWGKVTSEVAVLTVDARPYIIAKPKSVPALLGSSVTFQVTAGGLLPLAYQWRKDGTALPGATLTTLTISSVQPESAGNYDVVLINSSGSVTSAPARLSLETHFKLGGLKAEYYTNVSGAMLWQLELDESAKFPDLPDIFELTPQFESRRDFADNYGARLSGWLIPPTSGDYIFYLASDDEGALFLSDNASPVDKVQIASEPEANGFREFIDGVNQTSRGLPPINISTPQWLEAGKPYYIEARLKEAGGGDHLAVAWQPPGGASVVNGAGPIRGCCLASGLPHDDPFVPREAAIFAEHGPYDRVICVGFGRVLDLLSATDPANYQIDGATINRIELSPDHEGVFLHFSGPTGFSEVQINKILNWELKDIFGNPLRETTRLTVQHLPQLRQDVGAPAVLGVTFSSHAGNFDVQAGGVDIWNYADSFHFIYQAVTGDFDVRVRVESLEAANRWSKAGLMVRESLSADSRHIFAAVNPIGLTRDGKSGGQGENAYDLPIRSVAGGATADWSLPTSNLNAPSYPNAWIRLKRRGNEFTAFRSPNGMDWTPIGEILQIYPDTFPETVYVGLATTARNASPDYPVLARYRDYQLMVRPRDFTLDLVRKNPDGTITLQWPGGWPFELAFKSDLNQPSWATVPGAKSPCTFTPNTPTAFFMLRDGGVWSVNAVGVVSLGLTPGFNLLQNPMNFRDNVVSNVLAEVPDGTTVYKYDPASGYIVNDYTSLFGWTDPTMRISPGEGVVLYLPPGPNFTNVFVGEIPQGELVIALQAGFNLIGSKVPQGGPLSSVLGYPARPGDKTYLRRSGTYSVYTFLESSNAWDPSEPSLQVGEAFWSLNSAPSSWARTFAASFYP